MCKGLSPARLSAMANSPWLSKWFPIYPQHLLTYFSFTSATSHRRGEEKEILNLLYKMQTIPANKNVEKTSALLSWSWELWKSSAHNNGSWQLLSSSSQTFGVEENYRAVMNSLGSGVRKIWVTSQHHHLLIGWSWLSYSAMLNLFS